MKILIVSLHVRHSAQAVALAAGNLKAALPPRLRQTTRLLDLYLRQPVPQMLETIKAAKADLVAFSLYLWNRPQIQQLAEELKGPNGPFLLAGGPEASADSGRLLATGAFDAILRGEGEESFALLAERISRGESLEGIAGLCLDPQQPPVEACCCDIEQLASPWLNNDLLPVKGGVLWEVARGCPFNCSFCYDAKGMAGVRPLPFSRLAAELELFCRNGAEQVWVLDSTFNAPQKRGVRLLQLLLEKAPHLHYHLEAKADFIDAKTIELLSQLSCSIQLGLQSADTEVLAGLNRKIKPEKFWSGVELLANSGLTFGLDLIYGLPGDSYAGFSSSLGRTLGYRPNQVDIFPLAVLPGTGLYERKKELGLEADDRPPYLLRRSSDFSAGQMQRCALLAAATDLFYNLGRAVGFLLPCCEALKISPLQLVEDFRDWFIEAEGEEALLATENRQPRQILQLQQDFMRQRFTLAGQQSLLPLVRDILNYHYSYAETLLNQETPPATEEISEGSILYLAKGVCLIDFGCDILGALEAEEIDLRRWGKLVERTPTSGLMIRRGGQVFSELLAPEFAELLGRAKGGQTRRQLLGGLPAEEGEELLRFALQEGLLVAHCGI
jgi:radical SAM superfamily enzyme YgiQ (UPF0313 family)